MDEEENTIMTYPEFPETVPEVRLEIKEDHMEKIFGLSHVYPYATILTNNSPIIEFHGGGICVVWINKNEEQQYEIQKPPIRKFIDDYIRNGSMWGRPIARLFFAKEIRFFTKERLLLYLESSGRIQNWIIGRVGYE